MNNNGENILLIIMWRGLFRFASLFMPKSWSDFWIPNRITDLNR